MMNSEYEIRKVFRGVDWDYDIDPYDLYLAAPGEKPPIGFFGRFSDDLDLFVNSDEDCQVHSGDFGSDESPGKVDSWRNISSNKIYALFRHEIKDFVDIWALCREFKFDWKKIINEAGHKEAPELIRLRFRICS